MKQENGWYMDKSYRESIACLCSEQLILIKDAKQDEDLNLRLFYGGGIESGFSIDREYAKMFLKDIKAKSVNQLEGKVISGMVESVRSKVHGIKVLPITLNKD